MAKYNVIITEKEIYYVEGVEAKNDHEAINKAWKMMENDPQSKTKYHVDTESDAEADEID